MTPTREELSARIKALPDDMKADLKGVWPRRRDGRPVPGLGSGHEHTVTELELIEQAVVGVTPFEDGDGVDRERVAALTAKLKSLPLDLSDQVQAEAVLAGCPNLASPTITPEHLDTVDGLLEQALGKHFTRVFGIGAAVDLIDGGTDLLEALCAFVTGMKERDPNLLTHEQARDLEAATRLIAHGALEVTQTNGGKPQVSLNVDWKAEAKRRGQSQRDLLVHAKGIAERLGLPAPRNLTELRPAVIYELLPWEKPDASKIETQAYQRLLAEEAEIDEEIERRDVVAFVEEVRKRPGIQAAQLVIRVPVAFADSVRDRLYVKKAT